MRIIPFLIFLFSAQLSFGAINLLLDDFNDGVIDASKWTQTLPNGSSSLTESGGVLTTQARGILGSVDDFTGAYAISGAFTMQDSLEHFKVVFRSDLSDSGTSAERNGVLVAFSNDGDQISIQKFDDGAHTILSQKSYSLTAGQSYGFEIIDYGTSIVFSVDGTEELTATDSFRSGDRIGFYSREFSGTSTDLDFISVSTVPEPSAFALLLGLSALLFVVRRRRK